MAGALVSLETRGLLRLLLLLKSQQSPLHVTAIKHSAGCWLEILALPSALANCTRKIMKNDFCQKESNIGMER